MSNYQVIMNSLKRKVVAPIYLFWGEETFLRDQVLAKFKYELVPPEVRDFNMDLIDGKNTSLEDIVQVANTLPFMSDKRVVIVENAEFFKSTKKNATEKEALQKQEECLIEYFKKPMDTTCLIFAADAIDRKRKIYKTIQESGVVMEFAPLKNMELNNWVENRIIQMGKNVQPEAIDELVAAVGSNLRMLDTELQKIVSFVGERKVIDKEDVLGLVSKTTDLSIFELIDAIGERNYNKAILMLRELVLYGEPPVRLLFMVAKHFRILLEAKSLAQAGYAEKQVASQLQIHPYVAQKCVRQAKNFSRDELEKALERILETDIAIKTSTRQPIMNLELLFIQLCSRDAG